MTELLIVIEGNPVGSVRAEKGGRLSLHYENSWRTSEKAYSLSLSMPLSGESYPQKLVLPHLWNLLPENPNLLQRWGQQYHVSSTNPFKLLSFVGLDVPGAAQFVPPDRLEQVQSAGRPKIDWISLDNLAERLQQLRADSAAMRRAGDIGRVSLPGAQAKTAFYLDEKSNRWGVPSGRAPTTHIIKPCVPGFNGLVENEHLCQDIASRLGLPAARSFVLQLDEPYIVVERYDRLPPESGSPFVQRVHQEDLCQALGLMPGKKYQEEGGPGIPQIVALIRRVSSSEEQDIDRFLRANIFNWLIGGTDAHAKNYSLLIAAGDEVRLAPLYDVSSQLPYPDSISQRLAMKIGEHYDIAKIGIDDWRQLARMCAVAEEHLLTLITEMASALPTHIAAAREQALADGLAERAVLPLTRQLIAHSRQRLEAIMGPRSSRRKKR
jgi:serine/threonine-protein kinase HipA